MLTRWIVAHKRSLLLLLLLPVAAGVFAALSLPVTLFPDVQFPRVRMSLEAGDRPAEQMAVQVTAPVEQAVHRVPHVIDVRSRSSRGTAEVDMAFDWGTDMAAATLQVGQAVGQILPTLPPGTGMTTRRMDPTVFPVISYSMVSKTVPLGTLRDIATYQIRPLLTGVTGVASVSVTGGSDEEFQVLVDPTRLMAKSLTVDDVAKAVSSTNVLRAVGRIEDKYKLFLVVSDDTVDGLAQLGKTVVQSGAAGVVRVSDVAEVRRSTVPEWIRVTADGQDAILFNVYEQPGGNVVQIAAGVKKALDGFKSSLPPGVALANWYDQSQLVTASATSVRDAILIGAGLAALVLLAFLRSFKIMVIAVMVVPAALAATAGLLSALKMSFNIMTLGGMAAAVGLIIDDAIVMVEHIVGRLQAGAGQGRQESVVWVASEFLRPLAGSSAASVVIFLPLTFLSGVTGSFFSALSLTMASGLVFSFLITWLAVPLLVQWLFSSKDAEPKKQGRIGRAFDGGYAWLAARLLRVPALTVLLLAVPLGAGGYFAYKAVGSGFMPHMDEGGFIIDYRSAPGTALSETDRLLGQVEALIKATPEVDTWSRRTGAGLGGDLSEPNVGDYFVRLKSGSRRPIDDVMNELRTRIEARVPGITFEMAQLMEDLIGDLTGVPQPIEVKLFGSDIPGLIAMADAVAADLGKVPGIVDVRSGVNPAGDALNVRVDRIKAALEGVDPAQVTTTAETYLTGQVITKVPTAVKEIGIRVWSPPVMRGTQLDFAALPIRAPDGHVFPLDRVASFERVSGQPEITRENLEPMIAVTARIEGRDLGSVAADVQARMPGLIGQKSIRFSLGGLYLQQQIAFKGLITVFGAAIMAVFVLPLFLYESIVIALAILVMPLLATCAVFIGLALTGIELNITAMMGMTMIIGIVTEVAIFFFSEYGNIVGDGMEPRQALVEAGRRRFRAIAMTTIAAILTLMPLALAIGEGSAMQQPLAVAIISGLLVQLPLVLLVMPSLYALLGGTRTKPRQRAELA